MNGPRDELHDLADTFNGMLGRLHTAFDSQRRFIANASTVTARPLPDGGLNVTVTPPAANPESEETTA